MQCCRIARLLETEFEELNEPVIAESPFTQVTTQGVGIRQYHVALTSSKLLFASDNFEEVDLECFKFEFINPECETLTLVGLLPLDALTINFSCHNGRRVMRINKENEEERSIFLEMGGHLYKAFLWHKFWEQISCLRILLPSSSSSFMKPTSSYFYLTDEKLTTNNI